MTLTPGPWEAILHDHGDGPEWCIRGTFDGWTTDHIIAWANPGGLDQTQMPDDVRLITAAWELLEAAKGFIGYCDNCGGTGDTGVGGACRWCTPLRAAIAKATGEETG